MTSRRRKMSETCKTCKKEFDSGIWLAPQFADEKVLLFCSEKCKNEYLGMKLQRIKGNYPKYYDKIKKSLSSPHPKGCGLCGTFGCSRTPHSKEGGFNVRDITKSPDHVKKNPFWIKKMETK